MRKGREMRPFENITRNGILTKNLTILPPNLALPASKP
jgi:hypothetical protein